MKHEPRYYGDLFGWVVLAIAALMALMFDNGWAFFMTAAYGLGRIVQQRDTYAHVEWMDEVYGR